MVLRLCSTKLFQVWQTETRHAKIFNKLRLQIMSIQYHTGQFPPDDRLDWQRLIPQLSSTTGAVTRYDGMFAAIPNPKILLAPLTTQEAVFSSKIEGTQATFGEVLEFEAGRVQQSPGKTDDIHEVLNYRIAMREASEALKTLPLCQRVVREAHSKLLAGVRGQGKSPGEYRRVPVWIGPPGCDINNAKYVPIQADRVLNAMKAWEHYIHEEVPDRLVQIAILHAEFEAIHPFLDGNGRIGRMLVPLMMWQYGLIREPMFYISAYFESRRDAYYDRLLSVSRDDDWTSWILFFLDAVKAQAQDNLKKTEDILALYENMKNQVSQATRSQYAIYALDWLFEQPIFSSTSFIKTANIPKPTAQRILRVLSNEEILRVLQHGSGSRPSFFIFPELLNIAEGREIF